MNKLQTASKEDLLFAIKSSSSIREALSVLGFLPHVTYYTQFRERCQALGVDLDFRSKEKYDLSEIMVENSTYSRHMLKARIISSKILDYKCVSCGITDTYNEKKINLQLDHINGINNDNRLENLRFLCPNCHSQTDNWCGRNKRSSNKIYSNKPKKKYEYKFYCDCGKTKARTSNQCRSCAGDTRYKVQWPEISDLIFMLKTGSFIEIAKMLGCTDNAIRKHLKKHNIDPKTLKTF